MGYSPWGHQELDVTNIFTRSEQDRSEPFRCATQEIPKGGVGTHEILLGGTWMHNLKEYIYLLNVLSFMEIDKGLAFTVIRSPLKVIRKIRHGLKKNFKSMMLELEYAFGKNRGSLGSHGLRSRKYYSSASPGFDHKPAGWPWVEHLSSLFNQE